MNETSFRPLFRGSEAPRSGLASTLRSVTGCLLAISLMVIYSCSSAEPVREATVEPPMRPPAPPTPPPPDQQIPPPEPPTPKPELLEGSGKTVWADGFRGLIAGIDGGLYEPYRPAAIEGVQRALKKRDLYTGPINGILDAPTMQAIYAFQQAAHSLQRCGVPTPKTRSMLERGSHTDPGS